MSNKNYENWLNGDNSIETYEYWNDETLEKQKEWYSVKKEDKKAKEFIQARGLDKTFLEALNLLQKEEKLNIQGEVIDIAAGVGYTSALISKYKEITKVYCLDISKHRIEKIAPIIFDQFDAKKNKIHRIVGSFYDIKLPDESIDLVIMAQAFHHALEPQKLLEQVRRIMRKEGKIIVMGEQVISSNKYLYQLIRKFIGDLLCLVGLKKYNLNQRKLFSFSLRDIFPSDKIKGDTHYTLNIAKSIFEKHGFDFKHYHLPNNSKEIIYIITKI